MNSRWPFILLCFFLLTTGAHADTESSSPWRISTSNPKVYYAVTTKSNYLLGQYCYIDRKSCIYLVGLNITCKQGNDYPGLMNSDKAATQIRFVCGHKVGSQNVMYIKTFKDVDRILRKSSEVGFAMPLTAGKFKVVRFNLDGCVAALEQMRSLAREKMGLGGGGNSGGDSRGQDEEIL